RVHPEVAHFLTDATTPHVEALARLIGRTVAVEAAPEFERGQVEVSLGGGSSGAGRRGRGGPAELPSGRETTVLRAGEWAPPPRRSADPPRPRDSTLGITPR